MVPVNGSVSHPSSRVLTLCVSLLVLVLVETVTGFTVPEAPTARIVVRVRKRRAQHWNFWQINSSKYRRFETIPCCVLDRCRKFLASDFSFFSLPPPTQRPTLWVFYIIIAMYILYWIIKCFGPMQLGKALQKCSTCIIIIIKQKRLE